MQGQRVRRGTFSGRITGLVLTAVIGTLALCLGAVLWITAERVHDQAAQNALGIARTVAADPEVRTLVAEQSALENLDLQALRAGPLQAGLEAVRQRTGALFVIVTEDRGLRLAHPNPDLIGQRVSTDPVGLEGVEAVARERGTLGESVRAKVPVYAPGTTRVVGEVSAGVPVAAVAGDVRQAVSSILVAGAAALVLGVLVALYLKRKLRRLTLGLEPEEMAASARDQAAVLYGVEDGVIGVGPDGLITVRNKAARLLLGLAERRTDDDVVGRRFDNAGLPPDLVDAIARTLATGEASPRMRLALGESSVIADVVPVRREGVDLGGVVLLRDTTAVETLGSRLDAVETMAAALRAQRHEFANRLHAVSGLLSNGEIDQARDYVRELLDSGPVREPVANIGAVRDTFLRAFLGAKGVQAREQGVDLRVGERTALWDAVVDPQDATAILGNLVDNAVRAALEAGDTGTGCWVEVDLLGDGDTLHLAVADSGAGVPPGLDVFAPGVTTRAGGPSSEHGHGLGLSLARRLARERGGDVWLADSGGPGTPGPDEGGGAEATGAVFCARLPGMLRVAGNGNDGNSNNSGTGVGR